MTILFYGRLKLTVFFFLVCRSSVRAWKSKERRLNGIVSRDLHICFLVSIDIYHVDPPYAAGSVAFKISIACRIFRFFRLSVGEWSWTIRVSAAFCRSSPARTLNFYYYPDLLIISYVKPIEKHLVCGPHRLRLYASYTPKIKLTMPRRKNRKILKANEHAPYVGTSDLSNDTKKHQKTSRDPHFNLRQQQV
jgi:hypothetical protein